MWKYTVVGKFSCKWKQHTLADCPILERWWPGCVSGCWHTACSMCSLICNRKSKVCCNWWHTAWYINYLFSFRSWKTFEHWKIGAGHYWAHRPYCNIITISSLFACLYEVVVKHQGKAGLIMKTWCVNDCKSSTNSQLVCTFTPTSHSLDQSITIYVTEPTKAGHVGTNYTLSL